MTIHYIDTPGAGTQDGSSWTNARPFSSVETAYAACQPNDEVWINSLVTHPRTGAVVWTNANNPTDTTRIKIRGMRKSGTVQGHPEKAVVIGSRTLPWPATGGSNTGTLFRMGAGFKFTTIQNIVGISYERMFQTFDLSNEGVTIEDCEAIGVDDGFTNGVALATSLWRIRRFKVFGHSGRAVSFGGTMSDIVVEDCEAYCLEQDDNDLGTSPVGFILDVSVSNVKLRRCVSVGGIDIKADASYWQGDGFVAEEGVHSVTWEDCYASDHPDGGWDVKASNSKWIRCVAERNMRNFRFHPARVVGQPHIHQLEDCVAKYPQFQGGSGSAAQLQTAGIVGADPTIVNWVGGVLEDHAAGTPLISSVDSNSVITISRALIRRHPNAALQTGGTGATFTDCVTETEA